jgi:hypothetical protein
VRDADGEPMSRTPGLRRSPSSPADTRLPSPAAFPGGARQGPGFLGLLWRLELQHQARWGGPRAGARCALAVGNPRCSSIALTPAAPFTYAKTRRLPPHLMHANTSKSNVLFSNSAQSTRGVLSFIRSCLAAASLPALVSSAWGTRNGRSLAPGAKTPWNLVRFARGAGTRDATRRNSSSPVKSRCVVPSGSGRFMR